MIKLLDHIKAAIRTVEEKLSVQTGISAFSRGAVSRCVNTFPRIKFSVFLLTVLCNPLAASRHRYSHTGRKMIQVLHILETKWFVSKAYNLPTFGGILRDQMSPHLHLTMYPIETKAKISRDLKPTQPLLPLPPLPCTISDDSDPGPSSDSILTKSKKYFLFSQVTSLSQCNNSVSMTGWVLIWGSQQ